jgi:hypothetical protein
MSADNVDPRKMNSPPDFDDAASEALLAGSGHTVDAGVAQVIADIRTSFTSPAPVVGAELAALIAGAATISSAAPRKLERLRSSLIAKIAAGAAAAIAATGGLAVAGALPAPVQHAFSQIGIGSDPHHPSSTETVDDSSTTTVPDGTTVPSMPESGNGGTTPTSVNDNHGGNVSRIAHDGSDGCQHGANVSAVASDGRSHSNGSQCVTNTTNPGETTPSSGGHGNNNHRNSRRGTNSQGDNNQGNSGQGNRGGGNHGNSNTSGGSGSSGN